MTKKGLKSLVALLLMALGVYMLSTSSWPDAPFISGIGFLLAGFGQWIPHCPVCNKVCKH